MSEVEYARRTEFDDDCHHPPKTSGSGSDGAKASWVTLGPPPAFIPRSDPTEGRPEYRCSGCGGVFRGYKSLGTHICKVGGVGLPLDDRAAASAAAFGTPRTRLPR